MQLSGRPLLDNQHDDALFVGRDDVLGKVDHGLRSGLNSLIFGAPGSGKTSLVRALMFRSGMFRSGMFRSGRDRTGQEGSTDQRREPDQFDFVYVRANEARGAADFFTAILDVLQPLSGESRTYSRSPMALLDRLGKVVADRRDRQEAEIGDSDREVGDSDREVGDSDREVGTPGGSGLRAGTSRTVVIIAEDVSAVAGAEVFGALRDEVWQVDALWVVTTTTTQVAGLIRPPADVFFEVRLELRPMSNEEARELLRRRLDDPDSAASVDVISMAAESAGGLPRRLLEVARELSAEPAVGGARLNTGRGLKARNAALATLSRPARMLAQEIEALGWVSASDERLLNRMSWTRPRVIQVIAELQSRGLVEMREESTGRGRPRKLYRLIPAADFVDPSADGGST